MSEQEISDAVTIADVDHGLGDPHCAAGSCHGGLLSPGAQDPDAVLPRAHGCTAEGCLLHATGDVEQGDVCGKR